MLSGTATLRHPTDETPLTGGDITCFPQGPTGVHQLRNDSENSVRVGLLHAQPATREHVLSRQ
ncbi:MAG: hypothetical protein M3022_19480 [Actinomycetota bacterium]|nr:hypothetical protein [Actinomycetota bacterium]